MTGLGDWLGGLWKGISGDVTASANSAAQSGRDFGAGLGNIAGSIGGFVGSDTGKNLIGLSGIGANYYLQDKADKENQRRYDQAMGIAQADRARAIGREEEQESNLQTGFDAVYGKKKTPYGTVGLSSMYNV